MNYPKENLRRFLNQTAQKVDAIGKKILTDSVDRKFRAIVSYPISSGGKRLRPALAILSCRLLGGKEKDVLEAAAGLEILHNYTLIVDDIIDKSVLRRGKKTCWAEFGKSIAQCIGMDFAAAIFQASNLAKNSEKISQLFARTLKTISDGEIFDILFEQRGREEEPFIVKNRYLKLSEKDYLKMVKKKTAVLFEASCETGGIAGSGSEKEIAALKNFGFNLGIAFQVSDDILDIFGEEKKFGKKIGNDIKERKLGNIVLLFALEELGKKEKEKILKIIRKKEIKEKDIREAIKLIKMTGSRQKVRQFGQSFIDKAKKSLKTLPKNKWNKHLETIADFIMKREK